MYIDHIMVDNCSIAKVPLIEHRGDDCVFLYIFTGTKSCFHD